MMITNDNFQQATLAQLEKIYGLVFKNYPESEQLNQAYMLAKASHGDQTREFSTKPYITHPLRILLKLYLYENITDLSLLQAAVLHDAVEDTQLTLAQIREKFGEKTGAYVKYLTRIKPDQETPQQKYANKQKYLAGIRQADRQVRLLKCLDIIDNMESWLTLTPGNELIKKLPRWLTEAETEYLPLAASLGKKYTKQVSAVIRKFKQMGYSANPNWLL